MRDGGRAVRSFHMTATTPTPTPDTVEIDYYGALNIDPNDAIKRFDRSRLEALALARASGRAGNLRWVGGPEAAAELRAALVAAVGAEYWPRPFAPGEIGRLAGVLLVMRPGIVGSYFELVSAADPASPTLADDVATTARGLLAGIRAHLVRDLNNVDAVATLASAVGELLPHAGA
jgi:hypothetical protein